MAKLESVIRIVNLLYHRKSVTLREIVDECGVCERTAYRYLTALSEANIPLYFDKELRAYTLNADRKLALDNLRTDEGVLLVIALRMLSIQVGGAMSDALEALARKIYSRQQCGLEEMWSFLEDPGDKYSPRTSEISELIVLLTLHEAARRNERVEVLLTSPDQPERRLTFNSPVLRFNDRWYVQERTANEGDAWSLADIAQVWIR
jgi:predicted DNA-binding transcriptional regulator YafY